jgi:hypothetical protein
MDHPAEDEARKRAQQPQQHHARAQPTTKRDKELTRSLENAMNANCRHSLDSVDSGDLAAAISPALLARHSSIISSSQTTPTKSSILTEADVEVSQRNDQEEQNSPTRMSHRRERQREQVYRERRTAAAAFVGIAGTPTVTDPADGCISP